MLTQLRQQRCKARLVLGDRVEIGAERQAIAVPHQSWQARNRDQTRRPQNIELLQTGVQRSQKAKTLRRAERCVRGCAVDHQQQFARIAETQLVLPPPLHNRMAFGHQHLAVGPQLEPHRAEAEHERDEYAQRKRCARPFEYRGEQPDHESALFRKRSAAATFWAKFSSIIGARSVSRLDPETPDKRRGRRKLREEMAGPTEASTGLDAWPRIALALVPLLALLAYWTSLDGEFVWDDRTLILDGNLGGAWVRMEELFTSNFFYRPEFELSYGYYRPVTILSYVLDYWVWGLQPFGYHLTNVLLHAACSVSVGLILMRLDFAAGPALLTALLFAVHPIHSENVAWISGRTDLLAFFFCSLATLIHLATRKEKRVGRAGTAPARYRKLFIGASALAFAAALLAKEMAVVLPFWLVLIALLQREVRWRVALLETLPYFGVLLTYLVWRLLVIEVPPSSPPEDHSLLRAVLSAPPMIVEYLRKMVLADDPSAYIQNPYVMHLGDLRLLTSLGILGALSLVCWKPLRQSRQVLLLVGTTALFFAPILNFVRATGPPDMGNVMAERFCYFPSFPLMALFSMTLCWARKYASRQLGTRVAWAGLVLLMLFALTWRTATRNQVWRDEVTFLKQTLEASPDAPLLWVRLANHHLANRELKAAAAAIERGSQIAPNDYSIQSAKVHWFVLSGRAPEAIPLQEELVRGFERGKPVALNNLAHLYRLVGRTEDSLSILQQLVEAGSAYADVYANLAGIYHAKGQTDLAREHLRRALELRPASRANAESLALVELAAERPEEAAKVYRALLEYYPGDPIILRDLALARARSGELPEALRILRELIRTHPDDVGARIGYADLLHAAGRQFEAIAILQETLRLVAGNELEKKLARRIAAWQAELQSD